MFLVTTNKLKRLLCANYVGQVTPAELKRGLEETRQLLADFPEGFRMLTDFTRMESIDLDCVGPIGQFMELVDQSGVELVVRVIPDATKDIGMNMLSVFHYPRRPEFVTCETLAEAGRYLKL
jgi:hypothetical protein